MKRIAPGLTGFDHGPEPFQWTPRGGERYPRTAGSVAGDEPESGRRG